MQHKRNPLKNVNTKQISTSIVFTASQGVTEELFFKIDDISYEILTRVIFLF